MKTITRIICSSCGEEFDQNRDRLGDPYRCRFCGEKHTKEDEEKIILEELNNRRPTNVNKPKDTALKMKEYVYLIQNATGYTKIGISKQPKQRKRSLQTGSAHELELLATRESRNALELENALHDRYGKYHVRGEWFDIPEDELEALIERFKNE